jgi:uncharacterized protein
MRIELGQIEAIFRYPVKSMRGESLDAAVMGWHGLEGDRRLAFRRLDDRGGFPWLSAGRLPELIHFTPHVPTHVRTPEGVDLAIGQPLDAEISRRYGHPVQLMQLNHGMFDEAIMSMITCDTVRELGRLAGISADVRRFRPNILVRSIRAVPFEEDAWVGGVLAFGDANDAPTVAVTMRDVRCVMVNFDPDGGPNTPEVMKTIVRANENHAGIYGTVTRTGRLAVGQSIVLHR